MPQAPRAEVPPGYQRSLPQCNLLPRAGPTDVTTALTQIAEEIEWEASGGNLPQAARGTVEIELGPSPPSDQPLSTLDQVLDEREKLPNETSALDSSVSTLSTSIKQLPQSPTAQQLLALVPQIASAVNAAGKLKSTTSSACD